MTGTRRMTDDAGLKRAATPDPDAADAWRAALYRLLDRRVANGMLMLGDASLASVAIEATRSDLWAMMDLPAGVPSGATDAYRAAADMMIQPIAELELWLISLDRGRADEARTMIGRARAGLPDCQPLLQIGHLRIVNHDRRFAFKQRRRQPC